MSDITTATINELNSIFDVEFNFEESFKDYSYYKAEVINPPSYLFEKLEMRIQWNIEESHGQVSYSYTHPNGGTNAYTVGFIEDGKFKHNKNINLG